MLKIINGDLIAMAKNGDFDVIVHGCNCFHTMGAGIAKQIAKEFPWALEADISQTENGDIGKLGTYTVGYNPEKKFIVLNAYTQYKPGANFNIDAFRTILWKISQFESSVKVGFPLIGGGIGGGHHDEIIESLQEFGKNNDWTLVRL